MSLIVSLIEKLGKNKKANISSSLIFSKVSISDSFLLRITFFRRSISMPAPSSLIFNMNKERECNASTEIVATSFLPRAVLIYSFSTPWSQEFLTICIMLASSFFISFLSSKEDSPEIFNRIFLFRALDKSLIILGSGNKISLIGRIVVDRACICS